MDVRLLGSGSADGWPNPFCGCASCATERAAGRNRSSTSALLDEVMLLDCGPEAPRMAERAGVDLTRLRHVLVTHQHVDHCAPAFLLYRGWVDDTPLDVLGPPEVIEACRMWVPPDSPVRFVEVAAGDRLTLGRYDVRVLPAAHQGPGACVLYDVTAPTGRLLYATDTGPLPDAALDAVRGAAFDVALIEETFGDLTTHGTDHLDLVTFPEQVRRLRAAGALTETTDVVAVHLSHQNPPTPELDRRLAAWGVRTVADGTRLTADPAPSASWVPAAGTGRTLVIGGARSGKSTEAERILRSRAAVTYVATSHPDSDDPAWRERVAQHQRQRPSTWTTIETLDLAGVLAAEGGPVLVDCLTLWLARVLDEEGAWDPAVWQDNGEKAVTERMRALVAAWRSTQRRVVAVTNEVGQGVVPATEAGVRFRDLMGRLNTMISAETEDVRWCVAGRVSTL